MFDRMDALRREKNLKEKLTVKKAGIRGVRYVSSYGSLASPQSQYNEFLNY